MRGLARPCPGLRLGLPTLALAGLLSGCAIKVVHSDAADVVLPRNRAWMDGRTVDYVTTDVSDLATAQMLGVNHVPRLADALPRPAGTPGASRSLVERVYKFAGGEQLSVFQSAPLPTGAANADRSYSPLWRLVLVQWKQQAGARHELRSEEAILAAQDKGELELTITDVVLNCPIVRSVDGQSLKGVH